MGDISHPSLYIDQYQFPAEFEYSLTFKTFCKMHSCFIWDDTIHNKPSYVVYALFQSNSHIPLGHILNTNVKSN